MEDDVRSVEYDGWNRVSLSASRSATMSDNNTVQSNYLRRNEVALTQSMFEFASSDIADHSIAITVWLAPQYGESAVVIF
jgi:hypothetical protein